MQTFLTIILSALISIVISLGATTEQKIALGTATTAQTQTTDTLETFRTNTNMSIANLASNDISTTTANTWTAVQSFNNSSSSLQSAIFAEFGGTSTTTFLKNGRVGVASSSPWGFVSINPNAIGLGVPEFVIGSSTATGFIITGSGNVGIGTTTPGSLFSVQSILNFTTGTSTLFSTLKTPNIAVSTLSTGCAQIGAGGYLQSTGTTCAAGSIYNSPTLNQSTTQTATTSMVTIPIAANTIGASGAVLQLIAVVSNNVGGGNLCMFDVIFGNGTASTTVGTIAGFNGTGSGFIESTLVASTTASQRWESHSLSTGAGSVSGQFIKQTPYDGWAVSTTDLTAKSYISIAGKVVTSGTCTLDSATLKQF